MPEDSLLLGTQSARPLVEPEVRRTVSMIRSGDRTAPPAAKLFWQTLLARAGQPRARSA